MNSCSLWRTAWPGLPRWTSWGAVIPPTPPPTITTRGRDGTSGKSLLERSCCERHEKHQKDQQHTVCGRRSERQSPELSQNLHRYRTIGMRVEDNARDELADRGHGGEQPPGHQPRTCRGKNHSPHRHHPRSPKPARCILERGIHLPKGGFDS